MSAIGPRTMASALLDGAADIFERGGRKPVAEVDEETVRSLHAKIGELAFANDFVTKAQAVDRQVRRGMIEQGHPALSIGVQCRLLSISRSSFYHEPSGETEVNLALMQLIDRQFLDTPFYGVRQMTWHLQNEGHGVNPKRIRRLMRLMRLMPIYQKPNTSKPRKGHKTYPYLEAIHRFDAPGIMNTDQGSQFTSFAWTDRLKRAGTRISMDGKRRCIDNVFIERLWRSLKYECVYLHAWETGSQAKAAAAASFPKCRRMALAARRPQEGRGGLHQYGCHQTRRSGKEGAPRP